MVKMRLVRMGDKKSPVYRIVVVDARKAATGEYLDKVGFYDPRSNPVTLTVDVEKAKDWLSKGCSAHRDGQVPPRRFGRHGEERQALPFQDQDEEKEVIFCRIRGSLCAL